MIDTTSKPSVAIVKSRLYKGGVFQVIQEIIQVLNEQGIVPDIVTMKSDIKSSDIGANYNSNAQFNIRKILWNLTLPYEWHFLYFNLFSRKVLKEYDFVIDSNNTTFLSENHPNKLIYIHYPRKDRSILNVDSIHFPEGEKKSLFNIAMDPFRLSSLLYRFDKSIDQDSNVLANSAFTRDAILRNYNIVSKDIRVLYPPVQVNENSRSQDRNPSHVVSLGRFSVEKRQLEQIEIAACLPEMQFYIIGFSNEELYLNRCKNLIKQLNLDNVKLMANAPKGKIENIMDNASFFLHNVRNEPFGITTVQGISRGLIPVVHDSGGQKEIVTYADLRFQSTEDAVQRLNNLRSESLEDRTRRSGQLFAHCQKFDIYQFRKTITEVVQESLKGKL